MPDTLLISTADWDNPFWTNKQHVASELARQGHRILYVESLGLRRPTTDTRDVKRLFRRLRKGLRPPRKVRSGIWVWSPLVLPFHGNSIAVFLNRIVFALLLTVWTKFLRFDLKWLWTYSPITSRLIDVRRFHWAVYHCVDELTAQPRMPAGLISESEKDLCRSVDVVFTTSPELQRSKGRFNARTFFFPNVADFGHFNKAVQASTKVPDDLLAIRDPKVGFIGAISGYKIDFGLVRYLAESRPDWAIVMIGEVGEGEPGTDASTLMNVPNIHLLGPRPYETLPGYLKGIDVAILPNVLNDYTKSMFPMKFMEYLAAGKQVVSVDLDALQEFRSVVEIARDRREFVDKVEKCMGSPTSDICARLAIAGENTYEGRTSRMLAYAPKAST